MATIRDRSRKPRILLIEDNRGDALLTQLAFKRQGLPVEMEVVGTAENGLRFLLREGEFANASPPDLVLLDLNLPHMPGHHFLRQVKADSELRHLPIVVLSSSDADADIAECYDSQANGYITKPQSVEAYADMVDLIDRYWFRLMQHPAANGGGLPVSGLPASGLPASGLPN